ncbi:MAG: bacterial Ig-like domain-containing protein, partial [Christensenellales bacterium]
MKKIGIVLCFLVITLSCIAFSGCTHEMVSLYIYKMPDKLMYEMGEELDVSGLELKNIKTDSALLDISNNKANFSGFDSTSSGKKEVKISYGKFTTSFSVYVANKVVSNNQELKEAFEQANDNDIILIKKGEYKLQNAIEISNSNLIVGGEGKNKTIIDSFVIVGGHQENDEIVYGSDLENVSFISLGFKTKNSVQNNIIKFENEKLNADIAGINGKNLAKFNVISCSFEGFGVGIKAENMNDVFIMGNSFSNLLVGGIQTTKSTKNVTISKNIVNQIGSNVVYLNEKNEQKNIFGLRLAFDSEENLGISIYKNSISKIASKSGNLRFFGEKVEGNFGGLNYMHNSSAIILHSS